MKTILYLGTDPTQFESQGHVHGHLIHYPVIKIVARNVDAPDLRKAYDDLEDYTHIIFTSKNAVRILCEHLVELQTPLTDLKSKTIAAIGEVTAAYLCIKGIGPDWIAKEETQEGVVKMLSMKNLQDAYIFLPRSTISRPVLSSFFKENEIRYQACDLYETVTQRLFPIPDLALIDEIIFTSPSTVKAFIEIFGKIPSGKKLYAIGPITEETLKRYT